MKKICFILLTQLLIVNSEAQTLPTAKAVMAKYLIAVGGKRAIAKIKDLTTEETSVIDKYPMTLTIKCKNPDKSILTVTSDGNILSSYRSLGPNEIVNNASGRHVVEGPLSQGIRITRNPFYEYYLPAYGVKSVVEGTEIVNGKKAYKVKHSLNDGSFTWAACYDEATGLKVKQEIDYFPWDKPVPMVEHYEDYRAENGVMLPHTRKSSYPGSESVWTMKSVKVNASLPESEFLTN
jgi:hypothetical protein